LTLIVPVSAIQAILPVRLPPLVKAISRHTVGERPSSSTRRAKVEAAGAGTVGARERHLVVWTPPRTGQHVCVVVAGGADPLLVSHGDHSGPKKLRFSAEDAYQRRHRHGTAVWLSVF
jgi:hypothetical protein